MAGLSYNLPRKRFEQIVADGILEFRKKGASDEEVSNFVSSSWERYYTGEFNVNLKFKVDKEDK